MLLLELYAGKSRNKLQTKSKETEQGACKLATYLHTVWSFSVCTPGGHGRTDDV